MDESSFCKLKNLEVSNCEKLEIVIPLALLHRLRNLEFLGVYLFGKDRIELEGRLWINDFVSESQKTKNIGLQ